MILNLYILTVGVFAVQQCLAVQCEHHVHGSVSLEGWTVSFCGENIRPHCVPPHWFSGDAISAMEQKPPAQALRHYLAHSVQAEPIPLVQTRAGTLEMHGLKKHALFHVEQTTFNAMQHYSSVERQQTFGSTTAPLGRKSNSDIYPHQLPLNFRGRRRQM